MQRNPPSRLGRMVAAILAAAWAAPAADAGIDELRLERCYLPAGESARGAVLLTIDPQVPADARLRASLVRQIDVPDGPGGPVGRGVSQLVEEPVGGRRGKLDVPFEVAAAGMWFGSLQVRAELRAGEGGAPLSEAWSRPVEVGLRRRIDLAGAWAVESIRLFEGEMPGRGKDWKMPPAPEAIAVPGPLPFDEGFRGWVTLRRTVSWKRRDGLRPRFVFVDGASDSALVRVAGNEVGETTPADDYAALTHWLEYHCKYKGPANQRKRYLLMADGCEQPSRFALPRPLPVEGAAEIAVTLRGTSGGIMGRRMRPYGILNGLHLELAPAVYVKGVSFDASKPGASRRLAFRLAVGNDSGEAFAGKLRAVYGRYEGRLPYSGACPAFATAEQAVSIPPGGSTVEVLRDETPRFATCRATFLLLDAAGHPLDAAQQDYHAVTVEIRDRRDLYLNNERFLVKFQGSWGEDHNTRMQLRAKGGNGFRAHRTAASPRVPGFWTEAANINDRYADALLTSAGGALLASCEKCTFWDPKDRSNVHKAVRWVTRRLAPCPGVVMWEATNELHGEPEEARVEILKAFHAADPYHRPVLATKGSGEWEAEARGGRVAGGGKIAVRLLRSLLGVQLTHPLELAVRRTMSIDADTTRLRIDVAITNVGQGVAPQFRYMVHGVFGQVPPMPAGRALWFLPTSRGVEFFDADRGAREMGQSAGAGGAPLDHPFSRFIKGQKADKPRYEAGGWAAVSYRRGAVAVLGLWQAAEAPRIGALAPAAARAWPDDAAKLLAAMGGDRADVRDVAATPDGRELVALLVSAEKRRVQVVRLAGGRVVGRFGRFADKPGEADEALGAGARALAVDAAGSIWVATNAWGRTSVFRVNPDGAPYEESIVAGHVACFGPKGRRLLDAPGSAPPAVPDAELPAGSPLPVVVRADAQGTVWALHTLARKLVALGPDGKGRGPEHPIAASAGALHRLAVTPAGPVVVATQAAWRPAAAGPRGGER